MKNLFYLLVLLCTSSFLSAQTTITNESYTPSAGERWIGTFANADPMDYTEGTAGANVTWDFSGLKDSARFSVPSFLDSLAVNPEITYEALLAAETPFGSFFTEADWAIRSTISLFGLQDLYSYQKVKPDGIYEYGDADIFSFFLEPDTTITVYPEPVNILPLPLTYEDHFVLADTTTTEEITGFLSTYIDIDSTVVDAYGTLITPFATHDNVLRFAVYNTQISIVSEVTSGTEFSRDTFYTTSYRWHNNTDIPPLLTYLPGSQVEGEEEATLFFIIKDDDNVVSSTKTASLQLLPLQVYPNPSKGQFTVTFNLINPAKLLQTQLFDLSGKLVFQQQLQQVSAGEQQLQLLLPQSLSSGQYLLRVRTEQGMGTKKISLSRN